MEGNPLLLFSLPAWPFPDIPELSLHSSSAPSLPLTLSVHLLHFLLHSCLTSSLSYPPPLPGDCHQASSAASATVQLPPALKPNSLSLIPLIKHPPLPSSCLLFPSLTALPSSPFSSPFCLSSPSRLSIPPGQWLLSIKFDPKL